jgi:hypothetical protein
MVCWWVRNGGSGVEQRMKRKRNKKRNRNFFNDYHEAYKHIQGVQTRKCRLCFLRHMSSMPVTTISYCIIYLLPPERKRK